MSMLTQVLPIRLQDQSIRALGPVGCTPWRKVTRSGLPPTHVWSLVATGADCLAARLTWRYDLVLSIWRGGALLDSSLESYGYFPVGLRVKGGVVLEALERFPRARKILICDTLADSGRTLIAVEEAVRRYSPCAEVDYFCIYVADAAAKLFDSRGTRVHALERLGDYRQSMAKTPADIPYDFGAVAQDCGAFNSGGIHGAAHPLLQ